MTGVDPEYWSREHPHPLAPNDHDVELYRLFIGDADSVLLLGNTRALMELCTTAMDTHPFIDSPKVITQDWLTNTVHYDVIIGDGVIHFEKELTDGIVDMASQTSDRLIIRAFNHWLPIMRVAKYFPNRHDFSITPTEVLDFDDYSFFVWDFKR